MRNLENRAFVGKGVIQRRGTEPGLVPRRRE
jgi:hypothetical protein